MKTNKLYSLTLVDDLCNLYRPQYCAILFHNPVFHYILGIYCFFWQKSRVIFVSLQENYARFPQYMDFSSIYGLILINYILFKNFKKFMYGTCSSIGILIFNILISGKPLSSIMQLCIMQLCNLKTNLIKTLHSVIKCISCHELKRTNYSVE